MHYREIAPHPLLRPFVRTFWSLQGASTDSGPQPVMPDGTTELIVHRARPFWRYLADGAAEQQAPLLFVGQMQMPAIIHPDGEADVVSARFTPYGAFALLGLPQRELGDQIVDAESLALPWLRATLRRARAAASSSEAIDHLQSALLHQLANNPRRPRPIALIHSAVELIDRASGAIAIDDAAKRLGTNRRQLERLFDRHVGLSPKIYARVVRFQAAASQLAAEPERPMADVSASAGYFDQSHMIRDFLTFADRSPAAFRQHLSALTSALLARDS